MDSDIRARSLGGAAVAHKSLVVQSIRAIQRVARNALLAAVIYLRVRVTRHGDRQRSRSDFHITVRHNERHIGEVTVGIMEMTFKIHVDSTNIGRGDIIRAIESEIGFRV